MAAPIPAPAPRQTRPGLPTEPCPKCRSRRTWAAEPGLGGKHTLACWACGFVLAEWAPGQPDWQICAPRAPQLADLVAAKRDADARLAPRLSTGHDQDPAQCA